jgi:hypothetical protein
MQDDQLIQDLEPMSPYAAPTIAALRQGGITTYSRVFALIRDENADAELRATATWAMSWLRKIVDKRRSVSPLLTALQSTDEKVRCAAAHTLGMLESRRAIKPLMEFASDKNQSLRVRVDSILALCSIDDQRNSDFLRKVAFDQGENVEVRSAAIEFSYDQDFNRTFQDWVKLLSDPASDIRFWSAYRLSQHFDNITPSLSKLDHVVAFDHTLPEYWGWHVDREAMMALENAYMQHWMGITDEDGEYCSSFYTWLISPAPEYMTFIQNYRQMADDATYTTAPISPVTLEIDPTWLADRLREQWLDAQLNARQPRPQAYMLDWRMTVDGKILSGALHRDRYAVVITADDIYPFAAWYRSIITPEQPLFLYEWADYGVALHPGMSASDIETAKKGEDDSHTSKA